MKGQYAVGKIVGTPGKYDMAGGKGMQGWREQSYVTLGISFHLLSLSWWSLRDNM